MRGRSWSPVGTNTTGAGFCGWYCGGTWTWYVRLRPPTVSERVRRRTHHDSKSLISHMSDPLTFSQRPRPRIAPHALLQERSGRPPGVVARLRGHCSFLANDMEDGPLAKPNKKGHAHDLAVAVAGPKANHLNRLRTHFPMIESSSGSQPNNPSIGVSMAKHKAKASTNAEGSAAEQDNGSNQVGAETVSGYFRNLFEQNPNWLDERSNQRLLDRWLRDHPGSRKFPTGSSRTCPT